MGCARDRNKRHLENRGFGPLFFIKVISGGRSIGLLAARSAGSSLALRWAPGGGRSFETELDSTRKEPP